MSKKYNLGPDDEIHDEDYFRRQEAKPLTVERLAEILRTNPLYYMEAGHLHFEKCAESILPAIHAALPPIQPEMTVEEIFNVIYEAHMKLGFRNDIFMAYSEAIHAAIYGRNV